MSANSDSGLLWDASAPSYGPGVADGYAELLQQTSGEFASSMGLRFDTHLVDGTVSPIPPYEVNLEWSIDNGTYNSGLGPFFIGAQAFSPKSPIANPRRFIGAPTNTFQEQSAKIGQGFVLLGKAVGSALGTAATVTATLTVIANAGLGPVSVLAGQAASAITAGATAVVTGSTTLSSFSAMAGPAAAPAIAFAVVLQALTALTAAFPAESPSLHQTTIPKGVGVRVWYLENGKLASNEFIADARGKADSDTYWNAHPFAFGPGNRAKLENIDADTFFAGLVYLRAFPGLDATGQASYVNLLWTQRASDEAIAAFRAARVNGSVSDAIAAANALAPIPSPFEEIAQLGLGPLGKVAYEDNHQALAYLENAHRTNEAQAASVLANNAATKPYRNEIGRAAGLALTSKVKNVSIPPYLLKGIKMEVNPQLSDRLKQAFGNTSADTHASTLSRVLKPVGVVAVLGAIGTGIYYGAKKVMRHA